MLSRSTVFRLLCLIPTSYGLNDERDWYASQCGNWQAKYRKLHTKIVTGILPPRYVIFSMSSGLADCLSGVVTAFYFSLLTDRAFKIADKRWPLVYNRVSVDWFEERSFEYFANESNFNESKTAIIKENYVQKGKKILFAAFASKSLKSVHSDFTTILIRTHFGLTHKLFDNPHHYRELYAMGLRPETAYGCALSFLFEPWPSVMAPIASIISKLDQTDPGFIGIQIRVGDQAFRNKTLHVNLSSYLPFIQCAEKIEQIAYSNNSRVKWYLISDSLHVRRQAQQLYPHKIVTSITDALSNMRFDQKDAGMSLAVAENWLFSSAQYFVISPRSGFGRSAAVRSMRWKAVYTVDAKAKQACYLTNFETLIRLPPYI